MQHSFAVEEMAQYIYLQDDSVLGENVQIINATPEVLSNRLASAKVRPSKNSYLQLTSPQRDQNVYLYQAQNSQSPQGNVIHAASYQAQQQTSPQQQWAQNLATGQVSAQFLEKVHLKCHPERFNF